MACLRGDAGEVRRLARRAKLVLGPGGRKHCVFACIRSGNVAALRTLMQYNFPMPQQAMVYIPKYVAPQVALQLGKELINCGASARQCSWTAGSVLMVVLPHCWHPAGVQLLQLVIAAGGDLAMIPPRCPARKLATVRPLEFVLLQAARFADREWASAAMVLSPLVEVIRATTKLPGELATSAIAALVKAGHDPRAYAQALAAAGVAPQLGNTPPTNPYLPRRVKRLVVPLLLCMRRRATQNVVALPYDVALHVISLVTWSVEIIKA